MALRRNPDPKYRFHQRSGKGILDVYRHDGRRTSLVMPGAFNSTESLAERARILALLATNNGRLPPTPGEVKATGVSLNELVARFMAEHVDTTYIDADGKPTSEQAAFTLSVTPLVRLYGPTSVSEFDSAALVRVRTAMISGAWMTDAERDGQFKRNQRIGRGRTTVNKMISRLRMMFRWGKIRKLVSAELIIDLECVECLKPGEGGAREYEQVEAVPLEIYESTLPYLPPTTADLVRILQLTGARCGEICSMRMGDIDRAGPVWVYRPRRHKTKKRRGKREINLGPKAQRILEQYLKANPDAFLFSPSEQAERIAEVKRAKRKSKVQPSQLDRSRLDATRKPGERYTVRGVGHAVARACRRGGIPHWHPHQLRHLYAKTISIDEGTEVARISLGHKTQSMTVRYAGQDAARAADVALKVG